MNIFATYTIICGLQNYLTVLKLRKRFQEFFVCFSWYLFHVRISLRHVQINVVTIIRANKRDR